MMFFLAAFALLITWYVYEASKRRTRAMPGGLDETIALPHDREWELYHNSFSLCSKKTRVCLAELGIDYQSHHIDLIETGAYENISRRYLTVNPGAIVPVLVHNGHPIYESHEQLAYAAAHSDDPSALVPDDEAKRQVMQHWVDQSSLIGDDPTLHLEDSMGNAIPGLTVPIFSTMIEAIPYYKILEGLLFHRIKFRALFFMVLKLIGPNRLRSLKPAVQILSRSKKSMRTHLNELEKHLAETDGPWVVGEQFTLADVGLMVIFDRLDEVDWRSEFFTPELPNVLAYEKRLRQRDSYNVALRGFDHPTVLIGKQKIQALKAEQSDFGVLLAEA